MTASTFSQATLFNSLKTNEKIWHVSFWLIYLLLPFLKSIGRHNSVNLYSELNDLFFGMLIFYAFYYFLLLSKKGLLHVLLILVLFFVVGFLNFQAHNFIFEGQHQESFLGYYAIGYLSTYSILSLIAYVLYSLKASYKKNLEMEEARKEMRRSELSLLKSQINPHFLFNTLNTIYSSALKKEDKTADLILKLSDNFRYILHEAQNDHVPLKKEIIHLKDYIGLQRERHLDKVKVDFTIDIDNDEQAFAPLLLISFVENMFKYTSLLAGIGHLLKIGITLKENAFMFYCENPYNNNAIEGIDSNWKESGFGIAATKKRLMHLYPDRHQLLIFDESGRFTVTLNIQL